MNTFGTFVGVSEGMLAGVQAQTILVGYVWI